MSDLARWELRGPVRMLRTQFAEWNLETGEWRPLKNRCVATFRADGQLSEIEHHNPDGSVPRGVRVYDDAGRLIEDQWWSNDVLTRRVVHTYDAGGRPASAGSSRSGQSLAALLTSLASRPHPRSLFDFAARAQRI